VIAPKIILAALDFSDCSEAALEKARDLAAAFNASLHLLHIVAEPFHETWISFTPGAELADLLKAAEVKARARLKTYVTAKEIASGRIVIATAWGDPGDEILRYAAHNHVDLIVCGTHGRRGWNRAMLGSVAERMVRLARCPVLTVPAAAKTAEAVA
jgi:nucleotide-binding universal stress UspA family protein